MSSGSDDLDEDELLQIALKEQAQRELNYQRPSAGAAHGQSRPVVNLVQPPSSSKQRNPTRAPPQGKQRAPAKEEEDSEVELLSISSEDDDSVLGGPASRAASRKVGKDEIGDRGWDGEEPSTWKHVDEAELGRRVREMRETRSAPVAQPYEQKAAALGRKGLTNMQSLPRGMEFLDPLGLGIIDMKTLTLISDSVESAPADQRDNNDRDVVDQTMREKLMFYSDKFDARLFLSRIHQNTSVADLESGALGLKTDLRGRTQQRKQLVKENFDCFVSCKTTIDDIQSKLKRIEEDPEGAGTANLYNCIRDVSSVANRALEPLFERQVQAEKIRSVQGMLQRFRTLFNLPSAIRGNISKGEYDLAVREYRKAKSIVLPSHAGMLKRVLEEVEKVMHEFKSKLYKSMEDPQIALSDLENTVRLLLELEPDSDPVWHYLNIQNRRIRGLLEKCTLDHEHRMEALHSQKRDKILLDVRWRQLQHDPNKSSPVDLSVLLGPNTASLDAPPVDLAGEEVDALRGRYIRHLTAVLIHHVPAFWRLALSVFHGKFAKVMNAFRDLEDSNVLYRHMRDATKEIAKACHAVEAKESAPASAVKFLFALHLELARIYISRLCSWMRAATEELSKNELWEPVSMLERNKSPYTISLLPLAFQAMVVSAMDQIDLMMQSLQGDMVKSDDMFLQVQEMQETIRLSFLSSFLEFAGYLERIGSELSQDNKDVSRLQNGTLTEYDENFYGVQQGAVIGDSHQKLLVVLSNIGYCKDHIARELYQKYRHVWMQSREKDNEDDGDIKDLTLSCSAIEEKVLAYYTYAKANLIRDAATAYLLDGGIQWGAAPSVKGLRDAAVELLHTLISVHAEVFSGAKPLLEKTLSVLVEGLIDTLLGLFNENQSKDLKSLDTNGFCQLMLEFEYFETILHAYITSEAREALKSLHDLLLEKASESVNESLETPMHGRRPTRGEDALMEDRQHGAAMSPDDLIALAQQYSSELLACELERTRLNIACFMESSSLPLDSVPENVKAAYSSFKAPVASPKRFARVVQPVGSPMAGRQRRRGF
ncbi:Exocyst complex component [Nymphaea thermarum]|nr:Exocyst complex component [Nymphaea thermarum]